LIQLKRRTPVFLIALTWFELSPAAQALLPPPPPDGGYPSLNTAEGENALFKLTTGMLNTATIYGALTRNTTSRRHLVGKETTIWLVMVRWIPAKSGQTPPLATPNF